LTECDRQDSLNLFFPDNLTETGAFALKRTIVIAIACIMLLPATGLAQKKKRTTTARRPRTVAPQKNADAVREGATQVAGQIKILTRFIYLLGGVAKGIEQSDEAIRRKEAPPAVIEQTQKNKAKVINSLRDVRAGLDKLELDFRTTPALELYYIRLSGVAASAATAEEQAAANQLDQAGRTLLGVVNQLTDVLLGMR
jgi:hypothetical protein